MIIAWNGATGVVGTTAVNYLLRRLTTGTGIGSNAPASGVTSIELRLIGRSADRLNALAAQVRADYPQITVTPYPECFSDAHTDPAAWPGNPSPKQIFSSTQPARATNSPPFLQATVPEPASPMWIPPVTQQSCTS